MELKLSPVISRGLSPPDFVSEPEELEVSDEDDDDRNHKHRKRETESQSLDRDEPEQFQSRYRKYNKPFANGHSLRHVDPHSHHSLDKVFPSNFKKKCASSGNFSRSSLELNQGMNGNKQFSNDLGYGRGRLKESIFWGPRNPRFPMVDIAPPLMHPVSISSSVFVGRGLHTISNTQSASWGGGFGLLPRVPNGGLEMVHPLALQGSFGPSLDPSVSMAIPRQQCRDFEERGFCLRGDMCPMEHGVNHIVVEDVQSLSQFNLPVSLSSAHVPGEAGSRAASSVDASSALISSKAPHGRSSKSVGDDEGYTMDGAHDVGGADVYDPDQPLWSSGCPEMSSTHVALQSCNINTAQCCMDAKFSDQMGRRNGAAVGHQSTSISIQGQKNSSNKRSFVQEKADSVLNSSDVTREKHNVSTGSQVTMPHPRKRVKAGNYVDSCLRSPGDTTRSVRKPAQTVSALRTLFVSGIPLKDNKREALLSHFRKFGEVMSIYIPSNSERAFVQFSKRIDAERALNSPDAVMGNRFIKLWWANRDNTVDDRTAAGSNEPVTPFQKSYVLTTAYPAAMKSKVESQTTASKVSMANPSGNPRIDDSRDPKIHTPVGSSAPVSVIKKLDSLDSLKEQIRKKQEMLEQKRKEFRQQLEKLQKQAPGVKGDAPAATETAKLQIHGSSADPVKAETDVFLCKSQTAGNTIWLGSIPDMEEQSNSKQEAHSARYLGEPFPINRYKLDNRPTSFMVDGPLPAELANVDALREHFASFGDLSNVKLEDPGVPNSVGDDNGSSYTSHVSACVSFKTRQAAERAFTNGKTWNGRNLKFAWIVAPANSSSSRSEKGPCPKGLIGMKVQSAEKPATNVGGDTQVHASSEWYASGAVHSESGSSVVSNCSSSQEGDPSGRPELDLEKKGQNLQAEPSKAFKPVSSDSVEGEKNLTLKQQAPSTSG